MIVPGPSTQTIALLSDRCSNSALTDPRRLACGAISVSYLQEGLIYISRLINILFHLNTSLYRYSG